MSTHTPGPWTNDRGLIRSKDGAIAGVVYDLDGDTPINYDVAQANAAFIIRACNSHKAMLEALKGLVTDWERVHGAIPHDHEAHEAIRLAEGSKRS